MIIHLNGQPGVGKFTVAKHLAEKLNARFIDNHSVINTAMVCADHGTPEYTRIAHELMSYVCKELINRPTNEIMVFTNCLVEEFKADQTRYELVNNLARERGDVLVPVLLECDIEENMRRVQSDGRAEKQKLTDPEILKNRLTGYTFIHPADEPMSLQLDNTDLTAEEAAEKIYQHVINIGK